MLAFFNLIHNIHFLRDLSMGLKITQRQQTKTKKTYIVSIFNLFRFFTKYKNGDDSLIHCGDSLYLKWMENVLKNG